mmetsp:Transcript_1869/g.3319  ORF Transcript_1869/g.3319 Transcript_1869/m.3319 type:complete len:122 (-) Transcript_1869:348-713(-)
MASRFAPLLVVCFGVPALTLMPNRQSDRVDGKEKIGSQNLATHAEPNGSTLMNLTKMEDDALPEGSRHVNAKTETSDWLHEYPMLSRLLGSDDSSACYRTVNPVVLLGGVCVASPLLHSIL